MPSKYEKEWQEFRVGKLSKKSNWTEISCQPLIKISHVSHMSHALRIFQDGIINSRLVSDKSRLNNDRVLVVWLSPNDWEGNGGFRYGNVRFKFDWKKIAAGMNYYWIESMTYGIKAPRILLSLKSGDTILVFLTITTMHS